MADELSAQYAFESVGSARYRGTQGTRELYWMIALAVLIGVALIVELATVRSVMRMFEHAPPLNPREHALDPRAERVLIGTNDELTLHGSLYVPTDQPPRGLILFCHELGGDHWSALAYAGGLYRAGFAILAFDFRGHGQSDRMFGYEPLHWLTYFELEDVRAAIQFIQGRDDLNRLPLGLFGVSRGGGAALAAAAENDNVMCVAADGAYSARTMMTLYARRWLTLFVPPWLARSLPDICVQVSLAGARRLSEYRRGCRYVRLERFLPRLRNRHVLLISGQRDNYVLPEIAESLHTAIASESANLWIVPGARHNQGRETDAASYDARLIEFFSQLSVGDNSEASVREDAVITPAHTRHSRDSE